MASSRMADHVGRVLGARYRLIAPIGTGASARVLLAEDVTLRRRVAVKLLHAGLAEDETFLRRFRAEAQQAAALNHPNIMRVLDWGESEDGPFLVLEHLGGGSLRDILDAGHLLSPSQALMVGLEAARGLDYAHRRGLVHRDIKPANLLFDDEGRLCIADFGLARALAEAAWTEPSGVVLGTARYAAPEQAQGSSLDGKADVYALALVLFEAVTGRVPFSADTTIATLMARVGATLEIPDELDSLGPVLRSAAHPEPASRLDARRFAWALDEAATELAKPAPLPIRRIEPEAAARTVALHDVTELGSAAAAAEEPPPETGLEDPAGGGDDPAPRRRSRWAWIAASVFLVVLAAGTAYVLAQARAPRHPVPTLHGKTLAEAEAIVEANEFEVDVGDRRFDEEVAAGHIVDQDPSIGRLREGSTVKVVLSRGPRPRAVPDLAGLDAARAERLLLDRGFAPRIVPQASEDRPKGQVLEWSPTGTLPKGSEVVVIVSDGPPPREVPDLAGATFEEAAAALGDLGLKVSRTEAFSSDIDVGHVVSTRPGAGARVPRDSAVTVVVSKGPDMVDVPDVTGRTVAEATAVLRSAGLGVSGVGGKPNGDRVVLTDPQAGTRAKRGTGVFLYVR